MTPVVGFEDYYSIDRQGHLMNLRTGKQIHGTAYSTGYVIVCLSVNGRVFRRSMHSIIAETFIGPRPEGCQIDHINGRKHDNRLENLRYVTPKENIRANVDRMAHAYGSKNGQAKLTEQQVLEIREAKARGGRYWGANQYAKKFGVHRMQIQKAAGGSSFKYAESIRALKEQQHG